MCGYSPVHYKEAREGYLSHTNCRVIYTITFVTGKRNCMSPAMFDILMVISLGLLAGAIMGLGIGWAAKIQKNSWSLMNRREKITSIILVIVFAVLCSAVLAYYTFLSPAV